MKTHRNIMKSYLEKEPRARERANKNRSIRNVLLGVSPDPHIKIHKDDFPKIVQDILTYDRLWRDILKQFPELRGSDYGDKDSLEAETLKSIYQV